MLVILLWQCDGYFMLVEGKFIYALWSFSSYRRENCRLEDTRREECKKFLMILRWLCGESSCNFVSKGITLRFGNLDAAEWRRRKLTFMPLIFLSLFILTFSKFFVSATWDWWMPLWHLSKWLCVVSTHWNRRGETPMGWCNRAAQGKEIEQLLFISLYIFIFFFFF